jgi:RecA-family ATPase
MNVAAEWQPLTIEKLDEIGESLLPVDVTPSHGIQDAFELLLNPTPEPPEVIKGMLHQGCKMVVGGGSSKSFKTWCLTDLAVSVATGSNWWGIEMAQARVLYLNFELPPFSFTQRIAEIFKAKGLMFQSQVLDVWNLRGTRLSFREIKENIAQLAPERKWGLIVPDPLYKLLRGRDENSAGDMGLLMEEMEQMATDANADVAFGAHFSKGNQACKEGIDRISGSGVFARDPDTHQTRRGKRIHG